MRITQTAVAAAIKRAISNEKEQWLREPLPVHGAGRWEIRVTPNGRVRGYWRGQTRGRRAVHPLGQIGVEISLAEARKRADELGRQLRSGGLRAAEEARPIATERGPRCTLADLIEGYAARLDAAGKRHSATDVRSCFRVHVAHSRIASAPAASLESDELVVLIRAVAASGKARTAGKLRGFLQSAYKAAIVARHDPNADPVLATFGIKTNPISVISTVKNGKGVPGNRHLNEDDLGALLRELLTQSSVGADAAVLALFLAGQRPAQIARVKLADVSGDDVRLLDGKGNRDHPRPHFLPLLGRARKIVEARVKAAREVGDEFLFGSVNHKTGEKVAISPELMNQAVVQARDAATRAGHRWSEAATARFTIRELRRTCETMLAGSGVSKDLRAQVLSHGVAGVQDRHYDRHQYRNEKRDVLQTWARLLERLARRGAR